MKMKVKAHKTIFHRRRTRRPSESYPKPDEVTEGALQVWMALPEKIRQDPSLASFRQEHERLHGGLTDEDPLPSDDSKEDNKLDLTNEFITIKVTNELGNSEKVNGEHHERANNNTHDHEDDHGHTIEHAKPATWFTYTKIGVLLVIWLIFTIILMSADEKTVHHRQIAVTKTENNGYILPADPYGTRVGIKLKGAFELDPSNETTNTLTVYLQIMHLVQSVNSSSSDEISRIETTGQVWTIIVPDERNIATTMETSRKEVFTISDKVAEELRNNKVKLRMKFDTNFDPSYSVMLTYDPAPLDTSVGVIYAAFVLFALYVMIVWELVHRTFAAMVTSTLAIAILAALNEKPSMGEIMSWIDVETLLLLFGMMILVAILSETGIFDYLAVFAYKITSGRVWPLINTLCFFTAIMSAFLDNVTTVLLMTPVTIRLCEVMGLNPVPVLMAMIIYSNVGGTMTPVGDPPNVIISSNREIIKGGITFMNFTMHMTVGVLFVMVQTYFQFRHKFKNISDLRFTEPQDVQEMRHEIAVWQRAAASLSSYSKDEDLVRETLLKKVNRLSRVLKKKLVSGSIPVDSYKATLEELQIKYPIRSKPLLIKSSITLVFVITFFFLHSAPHIQRLSLGWTALLGAVLLLILADREDMEAVLARVEWSTLLFFAALFVLMEALAGLGLIDWIGKQTEAIITSVDEGARLTVAILIILWVSAIASAFVDNIPLTTMMVKVAISVAANKELNLPLEPLVWSLAFGACLGGNGTLIGASANVVCAGVAEQHGYRFTFMEYFKVGFPIMLGSVSVITGYLIVCHCVFAWH